MQEIVANKYFSSTSTKLEAPVILVWMSGHCSARELRRLAGVHFLLLVRSNLILKQD
jgi:hypothetical protein